jgi:hypothetical protein
MSLEHCQRFDSSDSRGDPADKVAVFKSMRFEYVETTLGDRHPPESFGKRMQQHNCPHILDHHSALGDCSADVILGVERTLQGVRIVSTSELGTKILHILTCVDKGIRLAIGIPKCIQHLHLETSPVSPLITSHHYHLLPHFQALCAVIPTDVDNIFTRGVGSGRTLQAFVFLKDRRHVRATEARRPWTMRKWHLIPVIAGSRDGFYE